MNPQILIRSSIGAALAWLLLAGAVQAGMSVPSHELVSGIEDSSSLDYSALPNSLTPLSREYIASILGLEVPVGSTDTPATVAGDGAGAGLAAPVLGVSDIDTTGGERTVVEHELTNDDFADAYPIKSVPFTARTDGRAGREPGEPSDCVRTGGTIWYRFAVARPVGLVASTVTERPTISVAVYAGRDFTDLVLLECHTDVRGKASVAFPAEKDTSYYVQVTSQTSDALPGGGAGGPIVFSLDPLGATERVSLSSDGGEGDDWSYAPMLSDNGRFVTFMSHAENLVAGDGNDKSDVFVYDRVTQRTELVSVSSEEEQGDDHSGDLQSAISADGRYVAFLSQATNLVPRDKNALSDAFVRDRVLGTTMRVSVSSAGREFRGCGAVCSPFAKPADTAPGTNPAGISITPDGRFVAFEFPEGLQQRRPGPPAQPTGCLGGIYVHDRRTQKTRYVSVNNRGEPPRGCSTPASWTDWPVISADGRYVAFRSDASNLVCRHGRCDWDTNKHSDLFVHDRRVHKTELVSVDSDGNQQNDRSTLPAISADGRYVAFHSLASNLVPANRLGAEDTHDSDVFVHDRKTGQTELVSVNSAGEQQDASQNPGLDGSNGGLIPYDALRPAISADGRYVVFSSTATNLADDNNNGVRDIFLHDRRTGVTTLVSVSSAGIPGDASSSFPALSADASFVAFTSDSGFGAEDGAINDLDVFVHALPFL